MGSKYTVDGTTGDVTTTGSITSTSTTSGFLLPKLTTTQRDAIVSPATGLQIFNTTTNQIEFYNGSTWTGVSGGGTISGSGTTNKVAKFIGSTIVGNSSMTDIGSQILTSANLALQASSSSTVASDTLRLQDGAPGGRIVFVGLTSFSGTFSSNTTILSIPQDSGGEITVVGRNTTSHIVFTDKILFAVDSTSGTVTVTNSATINGPTARTYSLIPVSTNLQLLMSGNSTTFQLTVYLRTLE